MNVFKNIEKENISWVETKSTTVTQTKNTSLHDKVNGIDVSAEIKIKMTSMPLEITGSASYMNKTSTHKLTNSLNYTQMYVCGSSNLDISKLHPNLELIGKLSELGATHVIIEVVFGCRANI